jgi:hypothetical protein
MLAHARNSIRQAKGCKQALDTGRLTTGIMYKASDLKRLKSKSCKYWSKTAVWKMQES